MLAFLGAVICIIAAVHPGFTSAAAPPSPPDNDSLSRDSLLQPLSEGSVARAGPLGALHGAESAGALGLNGLSSGGAPVSRLICTPVPAGECSPKTLRTHAASQPSYGGEDWGYLRATAEELRHTVLQQKEQILSEQQTIQELTAKLSECEAGLGQRSLPERSAGLWGGGARNHGRSMVGDDGPSPGLLEELERAVVQLKDRIERLEFEAHSSVQNQSGTGEKGLGVISGTGRGPEGEPGHRHELEEGIDTLQQRIAELEQGLSEQTYPEGYKLSFAVRTDYMYGVVGHPIPELYAFTACLWLRAKDGGIGTPFSYAVPEQPNELVLLQGVHNPVELLVNDKVAQLPLSLRPGIWEHICVTWSLRDGVWQAFQGGKLKGEGEGLAAWHPISPGGVLVLGQEQDAMGGRFDASQALVGELSQFNLWDRVLSPAEIAGLADCSAAFLGNVVPWTDRGISVFGGAAKESPEACRELVGAQK